MHASLSRGEITKFPPNNRSARAENVATTSCTRHKRGYLTATLHTPLPERTTYMPGAMDGVAPVPE